MLVVSLVWHALFVVEVIWGLTPLLQDAGYVIWALWHVNCWRSGAPGGHNGAPDNT
jgi:hypothetical protein